MGEITLRKLAVLVSWMPKLIKPNPGSVIHIDKVLIIEMYSRYAFLYHFITPKKMSKNCYLGAFFDIIIIRECKNEVKQYF